MAASTEAVGVHVTQRSVSWPPVCETQRAERSQAGGFGFVSWGAGSRSSGFWAGRPRREGSRDELACPTRGQTNFGGQRMTRPQRRPASLRAFPEPGLVMRWPGSPPVSAVFTKWSAAESEGGIAHRAWGQCRRVGVFGGAVGVARGRGADRSVAEWNEVKSRRVRRPGRPPSAVSWRGGLPRPSELASDGRAQPTALGGRSFGMASCPGPRGRAARSRWRRGPGRRKRSG